MIFTIKRLNNELTEKVDEAMSQWEDQTPDRTIKTVHEIQECWSKYYKIMAVIIRNDKLQNISSSVSKLQPLLKFNNDEFYSECESIKYSLSLIYESELPRLYNIV